MKPRDFIRLLRPRQWTKNLAVFAAIIFAGRLTDLSALEIVATAFVALNIITGGLYAINDAVDSERDKQHPIKKTRPVASGAIGRNQAFGIGGILILTGLVISAALSVSIISIDARRTSTRQFDDKR